MNHDGNRTDRKLSSRLRQTISPPIRGDHRLGDGARRLLKLEKSQARAAKKLAKSQIGLGQALLEASAANHETHGRLIKLVLDSVVDAEGGER